MVQTAGHCRAQETRRRSHGELVLPDVGKPGTQGRLDLSLYASFTVRNGRSVLWYPERKFFLLGRVIGNEWFTKAE